MLKIDLIAPALPPQIDGLGDYSSLIAPALARTCQVRILTVTGQQHLPVPDTTVIPVFDPADPASVNQLLPHFESHRPDWILLQYNPFSYGRRGYNPYLPMVLRQAKRRVPGLRLAMMAHETFMPFSRLNWGLMNAWQIPQFFALGRSSEIVFLSIQTWAERFQRWFPRIPVIHLPVGSNVPLLPLPRDEARQRLNIPADSLVLGLFGQAHPSRLFDWVAAAYYQTLEIYPDATFLYVGPAREAVQTALDAAGTGGNLLLDGPFPHDEVARRLRAMDIMLAPYADGVSTRRGAFMAGIQHGIASIATHGLATDDLLSSVNGKALVMTPASDRDAYLQAVHRAARDPHWRRALGAEAETFYHAHFSWEHLADRTLEEFARISPRK